MLVQVLKDLFARRPPATTRPRNDASASLQAPHPDVVAMLEDLRRSVRRVDDSVATLYHAFLIWINDFEAARNPRYADPKRLQRHAFQVTSQNGEDGIIHEIFRRIGTTNRFFAEIGVGSGAENNTAFLLSQGWTGCWVDGSDEFVRTLAARADLQASRLSTRVAFVTRESIGPTFREIEVPREFDLLSIDVDQNTYYVWEGLADYRPRVVVVEYNAALPPDVDWKVAYDPRRMWDGSQNFGASLNALAKLASDRGYALVGCDFTGINAFFVRSDLVGEHFAAPFTPENHHEPPRYHMTFRRMHRNAILDRATGASRTSAGD